MSRFISILGAEKFIKALRKCCLPDFIDKIRLFLSQFNELFISSLKTIPVTMGSIYFTKGSLFNPKELYLYVN
ncbi:MAG: hypothetical protein KAS71_15145 [Bacteroidales bacterium]|nr:hypothetical protein [Bacteroidales bacterium]